MAHKRRQKQGDLTQLQAVLWRMIGEIDMLLNTRPPSNDLILRAAHALSQVAGVYARVFEASEILPRLEAIEEVMKHEQATTPNGRRDAGAWR